MKKYSCFSTLLLTIMLAASVRGQISMQDLAPLSWITGCWRGDFPTVTIEEQWMQPLGKSMLGMSRTVTGEKTVAYEFIRIVMRSDSVFYVANPSGQKETSFLLVKCSEHEAVFENPEHDFPQRITYRKNEDGSLLASIEGLQKGKARREEFPMLRAKCME